MWLLNWMFANIVDFRVKQNLVLIVTCHNIGVQRRQWDPKLVQMEADNLLFSITIRVTGHPWASNKDRIHIIIQLRRIVSSRLMTLLEINLTQRKDLEAPAIFNRGSISLQILKASSDQWMEPCWEQGRMCYQIPQLTHHNVPPTSWGQEIAFRAACRSNKQIKSMDHETQEASSPLVSRISPIQIQWAFCLIIMRLRSRLNTVAHDSR